MANKTVNSSIPNSASLRALYNIGLGVDEANPTVRGAWDAKNSVFWPVSGSGTWTDTQLGSTAYNGLVLPDSGTGSIYAASADFSTTSPLARASTAR